MKIKLLLLAFLITTGLKAQTNFTWDSISPSSSTITSTSPQTVVLFNDIPYIIGYQGGMIHVEKYNLQNGTWTAVINAAVTSTTITKVKAKVFGGKIYVVVQGDLFFECGIYENDVNGFSSGFLTSTLSGTYTNGWEFDINNNHLFIGSINISGQPILHDFNYLTNSWSGYDLTATLNSDNIPNLFSNNATISVYCSNTDVYFGFSQSGFGQDRLGKAPITNPSSFAGYNGGTYTLFKDGTAYEGFDMYLYGDGNGLPIALLTDSGSGYASYAYQLVSASNLDVNTATEPVLNFSVSETDFAAIYTNNYHVLVNKFSPSLSSAAVNLNFNRFDVFANLWETNSSNISNEPYLPFENSFELSLSNNGKHLGVYLENFSGKSFFVSNTAPQINIGAANPNSGICSNNQNLLIPDLQFFDDQNDSIQIVSISGLNFNNGFGVFKERNTSVEPNIIKFDIYGDVLALPAGSYQLNIQYTDGYDTVSTPINYLVNATGTTASFSAANFDFCESAPVVDLAPLLNIHNGGQFTVNSHLIEGSTVDLLPENWLAATSGNLYYKTFIDGCRSEAYATYSLKLVGTTTISTSPTDCGTSNGTADWTYVPDVAGEVPTSIEWSTGSNNTNLTGLEVGQYYCDLLLPTGCRSRGYGVVLPTTTTLTANITNVTCNGGNNGAIDLTITNGPASYNLVWSNGYSSEDLSNLKAGTYTVTLYETGGCSYYSSFTVTEPDPILVTFSKTQPTCGNSNGDITAYPGGGSGTYFYNWTFDGTTSNQITAIPSGIYELKVTDGFGCQSFVYPNLNDQFASTPSAQIINTTCNSSNGAINVTAIPDGTNPLTFVSVEWDNGNTNLLNSGLDNGYHSVKLGSGYILGNVCYAFDRYEIETEKPRLQDICIVTVDLPTTTNMVVWEKGDTTGISHYNIYRETNTLGEYLLIDTVNVTSESIFNDVVISPMISSWRYRISIVNTCGQEGPLSPAHKTLLMNTVNNVGPGTVDVLWDDYEGTADIAHYQVNRYSDQNGWEALTPTVPIGVSTFLDTPTGLTNLDYFVETVLNTPCQSEKINDFNSSRSNRERGTFAVGEGTGNSNNELSEIYLNSIELYPNPTVNELQVIQPENNTIKISVYSVDGTFLFEKEISSKNDVLTLSEFASGIYFVHLHFNETTIVKRVMKN